MNTILILLLSILMMSSISASLVILTTFISNSQGPKIIGDIENKLDILHNESSKVLNQQGNLSNAQRDKIITELEDLPNTQSENKHMFGEILNILQHNGTR